MRFEILRKPGFQEETLNWPMVSSGGSMSSAAAGTSKSGWSESNEDEKEEAMEREFHGQLREKWMKLL